MKDLYVRICRRWGPMYEGRHITVSAWAFKHAQDTGSTRLRNVIDGWCLLVRNKHNHCQSSYQRERGDR